MHPGIDEVQGNGKDDNCNGQVDEENASGCSQLYADLDGDGYVAADDVDDADPTLWQAEATYSSEAAK